VNPFIGLSLVGIGQMPTFIGLRTSGIGLTATFIGQWADYSQNKKLPGGSFFKLF
jgi:hypothetical protein